MSGDKEEKKSYIYTVYGLNIKSEIEIPELIDSEDYKEIDVTISYGKLPEDIRNRINETVISSKERKNVYVFVEEIARYNVVNGNTIIIDSYENADMKRIRSFLLGWAFGVLFIQRGTVVIHGDSVIINGKGIIIAGESGTGKSTLTAALKLRGYKLIADDVSVITRESDGNYIINPAYPQQKLCKDTMENLGYDINKFMLSTKKEDSERYIIPSGGNFVNKSFPMGAICEISIGDNIEVEIKEVKGAEKINSLMKNGYFINVEQHMGIRQEYFLKYLDIVKKIPFYKIMRPRDKFTVNNQVETLESTLINII